MILDPFCFEGTIEFATQLPDWKDTSRDFGNIPLAPTLLCSGCEYAEQVQGSSTFAIITREGFISSVLR